MSGIAVLLGCALAAQAHAGVIRGTLKVPRASAPAAAADPYPGRLDALPGAMHVARGLARDAVVYLETLPAAVESALVATAARAPALTQKNQMFMPRVVAISVGGAVTFPNQDPIYHNVFSLSPARRFDLGKYPKGQSRTVKFPDPGLVNVYCDIHSGMEAFILVLPHHGFTCPDDEGAFALPNLPEGRYRLTAWHPDFGERTATVDVPALGQVTADLEF